MKAFVRVEASSQTLKLAEAPLPKLQPHDVLIKVKAFGVGIHDRYYIPGEMFFPGEATFPYIIGSEGSGVIIELGDQVDSFEVGNKVVFTTLLQEQGGSWAEYASTDQKNLILLPEALSFEQGAAVPIAGSTAIECMRALDLQKNDTLFIAGASGAIGTFIIQMAAAKGVRISASASEKNHEYMRSLGVEKAVDYRDPQWKSKIKEWAKGGVSIALAIQPGTAKDSMDIVKDGGRVVCVSGDDQTQPERGVAVAQFEHQGDTKNAMTQLLSDIAEEKIRLTIEQVYPFEQAIVALEKTETRHARGKLVVSG